MQAALTTGSVLAVHRERERKFTVSGRFRVPNLGEALGGQFAVQPGGTLVLTATYFDTADLRLARSGVTLRRRTGGTDAGWHAKLPVEASQRGVRDEIRLPLSAGAAGQVPAQLVTLLTAYTRGAALEPVARLRTRRGVAVVSGTGGASLVEVTDDAVSVLAGNEAGTRFRELEVEALADGDAADAAMDLVAGVLLGAGAEEGEFRSKVTRALGPAALEPPDVTEPVEAGVDDPARAALQAHLQRQVRAFLTQDVRVRRDLPDGVHQMRVAARRLRSALKTFRPLVDREWADGLRGELGWIAGALGASRDREVLELRLLDGVRALPDEVDRAGAFALIRQSLDVGLAEAGTQAAAAMSSPRYLALLDALVAAARDPHTSAAALEPSRTALPPLVAKAFKRLSRDAALLGPEVPEDVWHETRIAAKQARYAAEAAIPVFGRPAERSAAQVERVTELLGDHQDCTVAADTLLALSTRRPRVSVAFAIGALYAAELEKAARLRGQFATVWPEVAQPKWWRWTAADHRRRRKAKRR